MRRIKPELGILQTPSLISQLRNLNCALSNFFYHLQHLHCALNFSLFVSYEICVAFFKVNQLRYLCCVLS